MSETRRTLHPPLKTDPELEALMEAVKKLPPMTKEQRRAQRISWVYGNLAIENPNITREMVEKVVDEMD